MRRSALATYGVPLATAGAVVMMLAAPGAQRRGRGDNSAQGVPVATNMILEDPDAYYGKLVTVSAGLEQVLSKTAFLVDQHTVAGPTEVRALGQPILVIAPYLTPGALDQKTYLLVRGEIVKFDAAALARVAAGYAIDLAPEVGAKYAGQPVLVANSVIDSTYVELGRKPLPPLSPDEARVSAAMKLIAPAFAALRTAAQESKVEAIAESAARLQPAFSQTERTWDDIGQVYAAELAREAKAHTMALERAAAAGDWEAVKTSAAALNTTCANCHGAYRERREDGSFVFKPGSF